MREIVRFHRHWIGLRIDASDCMTVDAANKTASIEIVDGSYPTSASDFPMRYTFCNPCRSPPKRISLRDEIYPRPNAAGVFWQGIRAYPRLHGNVENVCVNDTKSLSVSVISLSLKPHCLFCIIFFFGWKQISVCDNEKWNINIHDTDFGKIKWPF